MVKNPSSASTVSDKLAPPKVGIIGAFLGISIILFGTRYAGLFYGVFMGALLFVVSMTVPIIFCRENQLDSNWHLLLGSILIFSVFIRYYQFHVPASLVGSDPDQRAIWTQNILRVGDTSALEAGFYSDAPVFLIYSAISELVVGLPKSGLGIYAILLGVFIPLTAFAMAKRLSSLHTYRAGLLSAVVASILPFTVKQGFWPIPQSIGLVLLITAFLLLCVSIQTSPQKITIGLLVVLTSAIFTHKSQLFFFTGSVLIIFILEEILIRDHEYSHLINKVFVSLGQPAKILAIGILIGVPWFLVTSLFSPVRFQLISITAYTAFIIYSVRSTQPVNTVPKPLRRTISPVIILLGGLLFMLQAVMVSNFVEAVVSDYLLRFITGFSVTTSETPIDPSAATQVSYGLFEIFMHRGPTLILVLFTAFCASVLFIQNLHSQTTIRLITPLFFALALTPLSIGAVTQSASAGGIGAQRLLPAFVPIIGAVISVQSINTIESDEPRLGKSVKYMISGVIIVLCVFQIGSPLFTPEYPMQQRQYLTAGEVEGKSFTNQYVSGEIHTDKQYAYESIAPVKGFEYAPHGNPRSAYRFEVEDPVYIPSSDEYLTGDLGYRNEKYILHRPSIQYYTGAPGLWELTRGIDSQLESQYYNQVYVNNGLTLYWK